jgi:hypothetical protein
MVKLSTHRYESLWRVHSFKVLFALLFSSLWCAVTSCNKDDDDYYSASMSQFYAESLNLDHQSLDSITNFKQKFSTFLANNPKARSGRNYIKINIRIAYSIKSHTR